MHDNLIEHYYKVFGHFFLDHLFQLYKIKDWYENEKGIKIDSVLISINLLNKAHFAKQFYQILFDKVHTEPQSDIQQSDILEIGIIMGSDSAQLDHYNDVDKIIYLSKSVIYQTIPPYVIENGRNITDYNRKMLNLMALDIKNKLNIKHDDMKSENVILIINRSKFPRRLVNLDRLVEFLESKNQRCDVTSFDFMNLEEQIKLISTYKKVIVACGSVQVHISFLHKECKYIELCEKGFRYPNTSIYGNYFDIDTSSITKPIGKEFDIKDISIKSLFDKTTPSIIKNNVDDIKDEKEFYSKLIRMNCFVIHTHQDIYCENYLTDIADILNI